MQAAVLLPHGTRARHLKSVRLSDRAVHRHPFHSQIRGAGQERLGVKTKDRHWKKEARSHILYPTPAN